MLPFILFFLSVVTVGTVVVFVETLLVMMLGAVDTFMLSRYSDNNVAAVGVVNQLMNLVFLLFEIISLGTSILCSQYIGAGQREKVIQTVGTSLLFNSIFGLLVSVALLFLAEDLLLLMGLRPNLMADGLPYMQIVGGLAFLQAFHFRSQLRYVVPIKPSIPCTCRWW